MASANGKTSRTSQYLRNKTARAKGSVLKTVLKTTLLKTASQMAWVPLPERVTNFLSEINI